MAKKVYTCDMKNLEILDVYICEKYRKFHTLEWQNQLEIGLVTWQIQTQKIWQVIY